MKEEADSQTLLHEHDRTLFIAYYTTIKQFERYCATVERYVRIHGKKNKPRLTHVLHKLEDGTELRLKEIPKNA